MGQRRLGAAAALAILCGYVLAQVAGGAVVGLARAIADGSVSPEGLRAIAGPSALVGMLSGAAFLWLALRALGGEHLRDTSPVGIGWASGGRASPWLGLAAGVATAATIKLALWLFPQEPGAPLGPVAELASGPDRLYLVPIALALAPLLEELLFRGVLLAGLTASWGRGPGAAVTTLAFVGLHAYELLFYPPALVGVVGLALLTLWLRIRFRALGPAVAAHLGYNAVAAFS
jgi:membrane protease YdiL (CAAX protease family)